MLADSLIDWGALLEVIWISAAAGLAIAAVLGVGIVSSLRAQDTEGGSALALNAVTVAAVILVAGAIAMGVFFITDK